MTARAGLPAALLTPTSSELDRARTQIDQLAGGSYIATYGALGAMASGMAGEAIRCLRLGDLDGAGRVLRQMAAADLAAAELRDRLVEETPVGAELDLALGGLDEVVMRAAAVAVDPERHPVDRARAAGASDGIRSAVYVLTGRQIQVGGTR